MSVKWSSKPRPFSQSFWRELSTGGGLLESQSLKMFQRLVYCPVPFAACGAHTEVHGVRRRGSRDTMGVRGRWQVLGEGRDTTVLDWVTKWGGKEYNRRGQNGQKMWGRTISYLGRVQSHQDVSVNKAEVLELSFFTWSPYLLKHVSVIALEIEAQMLITNQGAGGVFFFFLKWWKHSRKDCGDGCTCLWIC